MSQTTQLNFLSYFRQTNDCSVWKQLNDQNVSKQLAQWFPKWSVPPP